MTVRIIASAVIAALLFGGAAGFAPAAPQATAPPVTFTDPAPVITAPPVTRLTAEEAQQIALNHAGFTAAEVEKLRTEQDRDNGTLHWDVEFRQGDWEYDYAIHLETGALLEWDREYDPPRQPPATQPPATQPPATQPPVTEPPVTQPPATEPPAPKALTREEALAIALNHAGFTADQVERVTAEQDRDDGIPHWDVEFRQGDWEYDYAIHRETGAILKRDREYDPPRQPPATQPPATQPPATEPPAARELTWEDALAIALKHAGLTRAQVRDPDAEREKERGVWVWEVDFEVGNWEYEYIINAQTGEILHSEKEYDD